MAGPLCEPGAYPEFGRPSYNFPCPCDCNRMSHKRLLPVFFVVFIDLIGFGIVIPVLPFYAQKYGASAAQIGVLFGVFSLFQFLMAPVLGHLSDRFGRRPILALSLLGTSAAFLLTGLAQTFWMLLLARSLDGMTGGNISTAYAYIGDVTEPSERTAAFGMIGAAFGMGFVVGPALGGLLSHISLATPFFFAAFMALANAISVVIWLKEPERHRHEPQSPSAFLRSREGNVARPILVTSFLIILAFSMYQTMFALFTEARFHYGATTNGWLFAYLGIIVAVIQGGMLRRWSKRIDGRRLLTAGLVFVLLGLAGMALSFHLGVLLLALALEAAGASLTTPILSSMLSEAAGARSQGVAFGLSQGIGSLGRFIAPVVGGWLFATHITTPIWGALGIAVVAAIVFFAFVPRHLGVLDREASLVQSS